MTKRITVVLVTRQELTRWQAARYRAQSLMAAGWRRQLTLGLASVAAVAVAGLLVAALLVILQLVP